MRHRGESYTAAIIFLIATVIVVAAGVLTGAINTREFHMKQSEKDVRDAAGKFGEAWDKAIADGFDIPWPQTRAALDALPISETGKVEPEPKKAK